MKKALREPYLTPNGSNDDDASFENLDYQEGTASFDYSFQSPSTVDSSWAPSLLKPNGEFDQLGLGLDVDGHLENEQTSHNDSSSNEAYFLYMEGKVCPQSQIPKPLLKFPSHSTHTFQP
jgi:hypothetical protein